MAIYSKELLSGSTNGRPILVTGTGTGSSVLIHQAHVTATEEIWIYASIPLGVDDNLTLEFGGTTSPDDLIVMQILSQQGLFVVIPGLILRRPGIVRAWAGTANQINVCGFVNRIL